MAETGKDINRAAELLMADEVVAIPTETVYGLAGNALSEVAIRKIFEVKNRPFTDPLIVHFPNLESVAHYVTEIPEVARQLLQAFSPGPLTVLLPRRPIIPDLVTNGSPLVAVRIPNHPLTIKLLQELPFPLVAPSANPFGQLSPTLASHVQASLGHKIPYVLDGGPCNIGVESTIVHVLNDYEIKVLRQGGVSEEELLSVASLAREEQQTGIVVPGSMQSHYAPQIPLKIGQPEEFYDLVDPSAMAYLAFTTPSAHLPLENQLILSATGNLAEAAKNLFAMLFALEKLPVKLIVADQFPDVGIGRAINDRLQRASAKRPQ